MLDSQFCGSLKSSLTSDIIILTSGYEEKRLEVKNRVGTPTVLPQEAYWIKPFRNGSLHTPRSIHNHGEKKGKRKNHEKENHVG